MPLSPAPILDHVHVRTVEHPDSNVGVWVDTRPGLTAVMVEFEQYGKVIYIPMEIARAVAAAVVDAVSWCAPERAKVA